MSGLVLEGKSSLPAVCRFDEVGDKAVRELPAHTDRLLSDLQATTILGDYSEQCTEIIDG